MTKWKEIPNGERQEMFKALLEMSEKKEESMTGAFIEFIEKRDVFITKYVEGSPDMKKISTKEANELYAEFNDKVDFSMGMNQLGSTSLRHSEKQ